MKIIHKDTDFNLVVTMDWHDWKRIALTPGKGEVGNESESVDPASITIKAESLKSALDKFIGADK